MELKATNIGHIFMIFVILPHKVISFFALFRSVSLSKLAIDT